MEKIIIEKSGVVYFCTGYETSFKVNKTDFLEELSDRLESYGHSTDYDGRFAGRVRIEVEFLAEEQESNDA